MCSKNYLMKHLQIVSEAKKKHPKILDFFYRLFTYVWIFLSDRRMVWRIFWIRIITRFFCRVYIKFFSLIFWHQIAEKYFYSNQLRNPQILIFFFLHILDSKLESYMVYISFHVFKVKDYCIISWSFATMYYSKDYEEIQKRQFLV